MSFDNKMIIDATRGTIARFVNHSCEPNCEMIKWTVGGEPRMALFAGPRGIMTGDELTYDYNFEYVSHPHPLRKPARSNITSPFSQKNIQQCRCGTESCRGVLGPKPKKPVEDKSLASSLVAGTKRKLQSMVGTALAKNEDHQRSPKKRKTLLGSIAMAKTKNTHVQSLVTPERVHREAAEHDRQITSRQSRALKRAIPSSKARNPQSRFLQTKKLPVRTTRITTVSFQHKVSKPSARGTTKRPSRFRATAHPVHSTTGGTRSQVRKMPSTPKRSDRGSSRSSESTESPNITPASLRSAVRRSRVTGTSANSRFTDSIGDANEGSRSRTLRKSADNGSKLQNQTHVAVNGEYNHDNEVKALHQIAQRAPRNTSGR